MTGSSLSTTLLQKVVALDPNAWHRLFQLHGPLVYSRCRRCGLQADDAADLVQDVFLAAVKSIANFRRDGPNTNFRGWLLGIARNKMKDHWQSKSQFTQGEGGSDAQRQLDQLPAELSDDDSDEVAAAESAGLLRRALQLIRSQFEERTWKAFWRFDIDGQPAADVARELGMTPNAVHVATSKVRKCLRTEFTGLL